MELIRSIHNLRPWHRGCVATIGNFDGVHLGHQQVLGQLAVQSGSYGVPTLVVTFEPHPQEYFAPDRAPPRLTRFREKVEILRRYSVDRLLCLQFDTRMAGMAPKDFIEQVLVKGLGVRYLVIGDDFRFGHERRGDFAMLKEAGESYGFPVVNLHTFRIDHERVSSTRVREALTLGDLDSAEKLLGRPYRMAGRVAHGDKRGRLIGFPTANLFLHRHATPLSGVYAVEMFGIPGEPRPGVANIGMRPTVGGTQALLEVHLFDFCGDLYGRHVEIDFLRKLRDERRFSSFEELRTQILIDAEEAKAFFVERAEG
ncbi:bifunctional riboflavin kinase/FMN adenylyltransferase [Gammaproteobacteria bacterium]